MLHGQDQGIRYKHPHSNHWTRDQGIADSDTHFNRWTQLPDPEHPREVYRWWTTQLPDPEHPREDNRWFWFKSKFGIKKRGERSDAPKVQHLGFCGDPVWFENSNGRNTNAWSGETQPGGNPGVSRDLQGAPKTNKYTENYPGEFKKKVLTHDQENSDGIPGNMPLKITEGLQPLSEEWKKCDLKREIQAKQILNSAEQTGQSLAKEKQKDIVSPGPGGVNKEDKYTQHSNPFGTTQARAGQASKEQVKLNLGTTHYHYY